MTSWIAACAGAVLLAVAPLAAAQDASVEGRRIVEIRVVDDSGKALPRMPALALQAGNPFDYAKERESLRTLYATGDYADIRVTAANESAGLGVDFVVRRNYYNNVIRIDGLKPPPTEAAALAAMRLGLGEAFRESVLREAIGRLEDALHADGFYQAKVTRSLMPHEDTRQMDIIVKVDTGPRARVGSITFKNQSPYSDSELLRRSKLRAGNGLTSARLSRASQRLKKYLVDQGYLGAGVLIEPGAYDAQSNLVALAFRVTTGSRVRVEVSGAHLSKSRLRRLLPIYAEGTVDDDLLQEGRRNVRAFFQREGYFEAAVQVASREDAARSERVISYEITRGDRFRLDGVSFSGNKYFGTNLLNARLQLQPASFASRGRFSQQLVKADADSIRGLYESNGFRGVQVTSAVQDDYHGKKNNLFVSFDIVEGPQTRVASLKLKGNRAISTDTILAVVGSSPGQPYSEAGVASDRNNILAMYYNEGFPGARFLEDAVPGAAPNTIDLTYQIAEGEQIDVAKVLLTGYQYTRPGIIARQVQIRPGGPMREGDVVETQRRLYNLGVFNRVQIAPQNPNGTDPEKTMVVDATEGNRYTIGYGAGFEVQTIGATCSPPPTNQPPSKTPVPPCNPNATQLASSPRGIFEISRANMFGRAQTLSFKGRVSTLEYRAVTSYTADNFLNNRSLSLQLTGYAEKTQDINTFTSTRLEGSLQLVESLTPSSSLLYRYFYRRVEASNLNDTINFDQIPLLSQPTLVSGFGLTYARDRRDNAADAKRGTFNTVDFSDAVQSLGSSASFLRGSFQNSSFHPFGRDFVFARSTRFGIEQTLGKTISGIPTQCTPSTGATSTSVPFIPLPERFFAGGGTSLRGFSLNQAGPRDPCTGFPVGGLAMLVFNQELRFPTRFSIAGGRLGGTIFYDGGNVYRDVSHISFAWKPPSPTNLSYFSHTIGIGIRYPTPVGPVRLDFGYQLNPAQYQVVTNTTTNATELLRLPRFQFFFNIGPVF
ncbi:MAG: POTRA domain-containing protein [Candidatus Acidiferrales bacterium]